LAEGHGNKTWLASTNRSISKLTKLITLNILHLIKIKYDVSDFIAEKQGNTEAQRIYPDKPLSSQRFSLNFQFVVFGVRLLFYCLAVFVVL
jgi:hypothetical protein